MCVMCERNVVLTTNQRWYFFVLCDIHRFATSTHAPPLTDSLTHTRFPSHSPPPPAYICRPISIDMVASAARCRSTLPRVVPAGALSGAELGLKMHTRIWHKVGAPETLAEASPGDSPGANGSTQVKHGSWKLSVSD